MSNENTKPHLNAFVVKGTDEKPIFIKIGAAWQNRSGGFQLYLDALPTDGKVVLLPFKEKSQN